MRKTTVVLGSKLVSAQLVNEIIGERCSVRINKNSELKNCLNKDTKVIIYEHDYTSKNCVLVINEIISTKEIKIRPPYHRDSYVIDADLIIVCDKLSVSVLQNLTMIKEFNCINAFVE